MSEGRDARGRIVSDSLDGYDLACAEAERAYVRAVAARAAAAVVLADYVAAEVEFSHSFRTEYLRLREEEAKALANARAKERTRERRRQEMRAAARRNEEVEEQEAE